MHTGDVVAHGLYVSLANIPKKTCARNSKKAWMLAAYIPTSKWRTTLREHEDLSDSSKTDLAGVLNRRLFHRCLSIITRPLRRVAPHQIIDADGQVRWILYVLIAYIADLEEQLWLAGLAQQCCPYCIARGKNLDSDECAHERTSESILELITLTLEKLAVQNGAPDVETPLEFLNEGKKHGLCGVKLLFWVHLPHVDICKVLCLDLLHGFYKFFYDHVFQWN